MTAMFGKGTRVAIAGAFAAFGLLFVAPAAEAAFGLTNLSANPASTAAGANTNFTISLDVQDPSADLKDLTIHLPPGLVGNPQATTMCTAAQLQSDSCPPVTRVGTTTTSALLLGLIPLSVPGDIYNLVPHAGEPARFGIVLRPVSVPPLPPIVPEIILESGASLRQSDLGLDTVLNNLPNTSAGLGIDITSVSLTLNGMAGSPPKGFIRNPTSCKTHTVGFDAASYPPTQTATGQATFTTTNCGALPFTPELAAKVKQGAANEAVELTTTISQTIDEAGLKSAEVILPKELFGNAATLGISCPDALFQAGNCPANTIVGNAIATSPLLTQPLTGPVALVSPATPGLPDLGVDLRGPLALKLKGKIGVTPDVRNIVTFDGLPDIPIANFALTFTGGPSGLTFANRDLCQPPPIVFNANFASHSGATAVANPTATVECTGGGGGGGGGGGHGGSKKPRAKISVGRRSTDAPTMRVRIHKGSEKLTQAKLKLPRQLAFSSGKRFDRGTAVGGRKVSVKHTRRSLKLKAKKPASSLTARFARRALHPGKGLRPHSKLTFKLELRDASGKTTRLSVRAK
jgi:hypothetical protein